MAATSTDLTPWNDLQASLAGMLKARARGIISVEYVLTDRDGREFGRLREENGAAKLDAGPLQATIQRTAKHEYRLLSGGAEILTAAPLRSSTDALGIRCAGRHYDTLLNHLRNTTVVTNEDGRQVARISGGFAGRKYEISFEIGVEGALPAAVLLLHHATTVRRKAYRT